jgi:transposase
MTMPIMAPPTHNAESCYGWIYKGDEKSTLTNSGCQRLNINGALDPETHQIIQREDERIDSESTINLFKKLEETSPQAGNIYVIADNAKYYRSGLVKEYLETSRIKLIFLPEYSPNLNLIEHVCKFFKDNVIKGKFYEKFDEFRQAVHNFFNNMDKHKDELKSGTRKIPYNNNRFLLTTIFLLV